MRTFQHTFDPTVNSPVAGPDVQLSVREIESAGLREVLQTPGTTFGSWEILDTLLAPGTGFVFREPLGHAREVKVALSGLFGRFVARAYLERHFGLSVFAPLGGNCIVLDGRRSIEIRRRKRGDLPDWIAASRTLQDLTIAEAKGSHDPSGPAAALERAWAQADRVDVHSNGRHVSVKRMAIVTRWAVSAGPLFTPCIAVHDPTEEGDAISEEEHDAAFVGLYRHHVAGLIARLGHSELAQSLRQLATAAVEPRDAKGQAFDLLNQSAERQAGLVTGLDGVDELIGGVVARAGPLAGTTVSKADVATLTRLDLRPVFVGVPHVAVRAALEGSAPFLRETLAGQQAPGDAASGNAAGGWIIPLGDTSHGSNPELPPGG